MNIIKWYLGKHYDDNVFCGFVVGVTCCYVLSVIVLGRAYYSMDEPSSLLNYIITGIWHIIIGLTLMKIILKFLEEYKKVNYIYFIDGKKYVCKSTGVINHNHILLKDIVNGPDYIAINNFKYGERITEIIK